MPTVTMHEICLGAVAQTVARLILQRVLYVENTYEFSLSFNYSLLEPMDVVFITDTLCGIDDAPVRITQIKDQPDGLRTITAEEMPWGASHAVDVAMPDTAGYVPITNIGVGPVNTPVIFVAPPALTVTSYQIWMALSNPDVNYGGCVVWSSFDDASYTRQGTFYGSSTHGVLTEDLVAGTDPDTNPAHALRVDLSLSGGTLASTASNDWALCLAGHEFIGYRFATLTGPHQYDLFSPVPPATAPYLRRGLYSSTQGASAGARFVLCNDNLYKLKFAAADVGKTIYLKFQSFNVFNDGLEDLSTVTAYSFVLTTPARSGNFPVVFDNMGSERIAGLSTYALNNQATGITPTVVGSIKLEPATYPAPSAQLGCGNPAKTATLELRRSDGTVLCTIGGVAGGVQWRTADHGFVLTATTEIDIVLYANAGNETAFIHSLTF